MVKQLILASKSPRRKELLEDIGLSFTVKTKEVDESIITTEEPKEKVKQLALLKGRSISPATNEVILAADTIVANEGKIFGKPSSKEDAYCMIKTLSGSTHDVLTGVAIVSKEKEISFVERTYVTFWPLEEEVIQWYISTDEPYDKAGAYGIQGLGSLLVKEIKGDYFNVVGLPIAKVARKLNESGLKVFSIPSY